MHPARSHSAKSKRGFTTESQSEKRKKYWCKQDWDGANGTNELVFDVTEEAEGGSSAECLTESIFTQGDTWEELRAIVKDATEAYYYDGPKPKFVRLRLVRDQIIAMQ